MAYLEDRVRSGEGRPILYGIQYKVDKDTKEIIMLPIEDMDGLEERRRDVGLIPYSEYVEMIKMRNKGK